jgi:hypothetical protein
MFIATLFTIDKLMNQPRCLPADEWIKKMWHIYTMEHYSAIKNKIMSFIRKWMDLKIIMLNEISHTPKDRYHMFSLISRH